MFCLALEINKWKQNYVKHKLQKYSFHLKYVS